MTRGVNSRFFGEVLKFLTRLHGDRLADQDAINGLIEKLGEVERCWLAMPPVKPKPGEMQPGGNP